MRLTALARVTVWDVMPQDGTALELGLLVGSLP